MRRPYVHLAGDLSGWPKGTVPSPKMLRALDQYSSELVNGDEGGAWAPSSPIVLGPYGTPTLTLGDGSLLTGDVETVAGNSEGDEIDAAPGLILQGSAVPSFQSARSRVVVVGFANFVENDSASTSNIPRMLVDPLTLGAKWYSSQSNSRMVSVPLPIRGQHRGATIEQVDFRVIVNGVHSALPGVMMRFRVIKVTGDTTVALHSTVGDYDANGWYVDPAATVAAFANNGQVRTLSYVPDQNHTGLDPDASWYMVQARPFSGSTAVELGSVFVSATVHLSAIADYRQE